MGNAQAKLEEQLFELKYTAKTFERQAKKCEKESKSERLKIKKALEKGNEEGAKIYAQNVIRKKNEAMNSLRLQSRIDAVAARLQNAIRMNQVSNSMGSVVKSMGTVLKSMNIEKISHIMDKFERQFEDLDVQADTVNETMSTQMTLSTPEEEVNGLLGEVADEYNIELKHKLDQPPSHEIAKEEEKAEEEPEDDLEARLSRLKSL